MSAFRKAKPEQAALKFGIYGLAGSGKTFTTLLCAEGLAAVTGKRIAYVDTERGTDFYCQPVKEREIHPEAFDFDAIYTRSITEIISAFKSISPQEHGVVVIDSITHVWEAAMAAYAGKKTRIGTIPITAWGQIKKPYKELMAMLLSSPMHVFILGRQGSIWEEDEESGEMKNLGSKMKAEGETPHEPHILIHMESERSKEGGPSVIHAFAEKDRTGILHGRVIQNPDFNSLIKPLLPLLGDKQAEVDSGEGAASIDAEKLSQDEDEKFARSKSLLETFQAKLTLAATKDELKEISKDITPQIKKEMTTEHVAELRTNYLATEKRIG